MLLTLFVILDLIAVHRFRRVSSFVPTSEVDALHSIWLSTDGIFWDWQDPVYSGAIWHFEESVNMTINPCNEGGAPWQAVTCFPQSADCSLESVECHIGAIDLMYYGLSGILPNEIEKLKCLSALRLSDNYLSGSIPRTICNMTTLAVISMSYNYFTGGIPDMDNLHDLSYLNVDYNNELSGTIAPSLFQKSNLVVFSAYYVGLKGPIPELVDMNSLRTLLLDHNELTGTIPSSLTTATRLISFTFSMNYLHGRIPTDFSRVVHLKRFLIDTNDITGPIPSSLLALTGLAEFIIYQNCITGHIPDVFTTEHILSDFYVDFNLISGPLPPSITKLWNLGYLSAYTNHISGPIPSDIGLLDMDSFSLADNMLTGSLPTSIFDWSKVAAMQFSRNKLSGTISSEFVRLSHLDSLYLSQNHFDGTLPTELSYMTNLRQLQVSSNSIVGTIRSEYAKLTNLDNLVLADNFLTGTIPDALCSDLTNMVTFSLQKNSLEGEIPSSFWDMDWVYYVYIGDNWLSGSIPSNINIMSNLYFLHIGSNLLTGSVPDELVHMTKLVDLNIESNYLTGPLPKSLFTNITSLGYVYVGSNDLTGPIPDVRRDFCIFSMFDVSNNMFTGILPEGVFTCIVPFQWRNVVIYAYFQQNQLTGSIPDSVGNMKSIKQLFLSENYLTGTVPLNISNCRNLQTLLLQNNMLSGHIDDIFFPSPINETYQLHDDDTLLVPNYFSLQTIDLSSNRFNGPVPSKVFQLPNIVYISVLSNCFTGSIPSSMCESTSLQFVIMEGLRSGKECQETSIDIFGISNAYYTSVVEGTIPDCIWQMSNLKTIHLSGNRLKGSLPHTTRLLSITDLSLSYNALSGTIPKSIQSGVYLQLDLSHNRFSGTYDSSNSYNTVFVDQSIKLSANRLSGKFPRQFLNVKNIDVLVGNIFECSSDHDLPMHDPESTTYVCGSDDYDIPLLTFVIVLCVLVLCGITGVYCYSQVFRGRGEPDSIIESSTGSNHSALSDILDIIVLWMSSLQRQLQENRVPLSLHTFLLTLVDIRRLALVLAGLICVVYTLFYVIVKPAALLGWGTHTHQYRWYISSAYLHGLSCGVILSVLLILLNSTVIAFLDTSHTKLLGFDNAKQHSLGKDQNPSSETIITHATSPSGSARASSPVWAVSQVTWIGSAKAYLFIFTVMFCNAIVVLVVKGAFVYFLLVNELSFTAQILLQLSLSAFDLSWNAIVMRRVVSLYPNVVRSKVRVRLHLSLLVFNSIMAPMMSQAVADRNCFSDLFSEKDDIVTTSSFVFCDSLAGLGCESYDSIELSTSYLPPFTYMYQCSSSLVTNFVPVMLFSHLFLGLVFPCLLMAYCAIVDYLNLSKSYMPILPPIFRPQDILALDESSTYTEFPPFHSTEPKQQEQQIQHQTALTKGQCKLLAPEFIISGILHHIIVMGTFGWTSPPLALAIACTVAVWTYLWSLGISRFLIYSGSENKHSETAGKVEGICSHYARETSGGTMLTAILPVLSLECKGVWQGPFKSMWVISDTSAVFSGFMVMDIVGDELGWFRALVYIVIPFVIVVVIGLRLFFKADAIKALLRIIGNSSMDPGPDNGINILHIDSNCAMISDETGALGDKGIELQVASDMMPDINAV